MSPKDIAPASPNPARRTAFAVLAGATALAASACGAAPTGTLHTRAGYTIASEEVPVSICPAEDAARLAEDEGTLLGVHFALRVECVASFTEVPDGMQLDYLFGEGRAPYSPEPGHEFTFVQFAPEPGVDPLIDPGPSSDVAATLTIGGEEWTFDGEMPVPGSVYLAVVEKDAPITFEVNDSERTQEMDLRARTRSGLIEALYHGSMDEVTTDPAEHSVDGYTSTGSYEYWFKDWTYSTEFTGKREVYFPGEDWVAELDRARLSISFVWLRSGNGLEWDIDPEDALKVAGPEGELTPVAVEHEDEDWSDGQIRYFYLEYDVPADAVDFTLTFHPVGPVKWPSEGISIPVDGDKAHELALSFA